MTALLETDFSAGYGARTVLHDICLAMEPGEILGLAGASGGGKSTLVMALLGLLQFRGGFTRGWARFEAQDLFAMRDAERRKLLGARIALIPPSPHSALNPRLSLLKHFREAWRAHSVMGWKTGREQVSARMSEVGLPESDSFLSRFPGEVSTGQAQRVLVAMALLHRPALLIADEPTSALDTVTQAGLLELLRRVNREHGTAILCVTHDLVAATALCHRLAVLSAGRIVETVSTSRLAEQARHPATLALLDAFPRLPEGLLARRES